jgi:hypothetical protein
LWLLVVARLVLPVSFSNGASIFNFLPHGFGKSASVSMHSDAAVRSDLKPRFVFLHELAHLKRGDLPLNWLIALHMVRLLPLAHGRATARQRWRLAAWKGRPGVAAPERARNSIAP